MNKFSRLILLFLTINIFTLYPLGALSNFHGIVSAQSSDTTSYLITDSNSKKITTKDLNRLQKGFLRFARNEIFARHGYKFKNSEYKKYFSKKEWYKPSIDDVTAVQLSSIEKYNVKYLHFIEKEPPNTDKVWGMWFNRDNLHGGNEYPSGTEVKEDLNGDGVLEKITYSINLDKFKVSIRVNDEIGEERMYAPLSNFAIVNINPSDQYREIIISDNGPSSDLTSFYYYFNGKHLIYMGRTDGTIARGIDIQDKGSFKAMILSKFLHTMPLESTYELTSDHKLLQLDEIYEVDYQLFLVGPLQVYEKRDEQSTSAILEEGQVVHLTASDNRAWCQIKVENGLNYWFRVSMWKNVIISEGKEHLPSAIFDGLVFAD